MAAGKKDDETPDDSIPRRLEKATANPLQKEILETMNKRPMSPAELADVLDRPAKTIRHHFRVLAALGYLTTVGPTGA